MMRFWQHLPTRRFTLLVCRCLGSKSRFEYMFSSRFLVLFALIESGVFHVGYYLYVTRWSLNINYSSEVFAWIYYILSNVSALGILSYVFFRNSRWSQEPAAYSTGRENATSRPAEPGTTGQKLDGVRIFELCLVLFVAFARSILHSLEILAGHAKISDQPLISSLPWELHEMLYFTAALGLLGYVLTRSAGGFKDLGFRWTSRDVAVALPLALGAGLAYRVLLPITLWGAEVLSVDRPQMPDISNFLFGTSVPWLRFSTRL